jgi:GTP-binding protein Era
MNDSKTYSGFIAIVGRPNVGKSTLLNQLLKQKVAITADKPQTTRHQIIGVSTKENRQLIFVDTPGMHLGQKKAINRYMNKTARAALIDVDCVLFVLEALKWTEEDSLVAQALESVTAPIFVLINKVDLLKDKTKLLPFLTEVQTRCPKAEIIPISAGKNIQIDLLKNKLWQLLPEGVFYFPPEQVTDKSIEFQLSEIIREKLIRFLGDELPYAVSVQIEKMELKNNCQHIHGLIWIERETQKPIIIGAEGEKLKLIGQQARLDMEKLLNQKVFLALWVKVKENWADNLSALTTLGYE